MTLANFPDLQRLSRPARLKIAAELWDSAVSDARRYAIASSRNRLRTAGTHNLPHLHRGSVSELPAGIPKPCATQFKSVLNWCYVIIPFIAK